MSDQINFPATGRYYVARYAIPIFYTGQVYWPIVDPKGNRMVTVVGSGVSVGNAHDTDVEISRLPADRLVEVLNQTLP